MSKVNEYIEALRAWRGEHPLLDAGLGFVPYVGTAMAMDDFKEEPSLLGAVGLVPPPLVKGIKVWRETNKFRKGLGDLWHQPVSTKRPSHLGPNGELKLKKGERYPYSPDGEGLSYGYKDQHIDIPKEDLIFHDPTLRGNAFHNQMAKPGEIFVGDDSRAKLIREYLRKPPRPNKQVLTEKQTKNWFKKKEELEAVIADVKAYLNRKYE